MSPSPALSVALVCDATEATGLGHLSRSVALGEALVDAGAQVTVVGTLQPSWAAMAHLPGIEAMAVASPLGTGGAVDARLAALGALAPQVVVVDSYAVDADDLAALRGRRASCCIDDFARLTHYPTDLVLNFTVGASALAYPDHAGLLLGPEFFLARRPLRTLRRTRPDHRASTTVERVLVTMGGGDRGAATLQVVEALHAVDPQLVVDVVLGRPTADDGALAAAVAAAGAGSAVVVGAASLAPHLAAADLVVCGGGLTKYEAAYLGLPVAVVDQTADQATETHEFAARGLAVPLGRVGHLHPDALADDLARLVHDRSTRAALGRAGWATFPDDPTAAAAERLLARA